MELEAEVQELLRKWEDEELTHELFLTKEQKAWLHKAIYMFWAYEKQARFTSAGDKVLTEAMVRYIMGQFEKNDEERKNHGTTS